MNKRIASLLAATIFASNILGTAAFAEQSVSPVKVEMTIQEAQKYASEHNSAIRDAKKLYDDYSDTYSDLKDETRNMQNRPNITFDFDSQPSVGTYATTDNHQYSVYKGYALEDKKNIYDDLAKAKDFVEQVIYYKIEKLAYGIDEMQDSINYCKNMKKTLEKSLSIVRIKYKLKMANNLEVSKAKDAVTQMDSTIKQLNDTLATQEDALKTLLGMDRNNDLNIKTQKLEFKPLGEVNLEDIEKKAIEKRQDAIVAAHKLRGKEIDYLVCDFEKKSMPYKTYTDAITAYDNAKTDYEQTSNQIKSNVKEIYEAVKTSENTYNDTLESFNNTAETNRIDKVKYANGMISQVELLASNLAYQKAQNDLQKALNDNIIANKWFIAAYTIGDLE